jgi:hypothetical protein
MRDPETIFASKLRLSLQPALSKGYLCTPFAAFPPFFTFRKA